MSMRKAVACATLALSSLVPAPRARAAGIILPEPRLHQLAPDVYAYTAAHDVAGEALVNVSGIVATSEGVVIFDGMEDVEASRRLRRAAEGLGRGPVRFLVAGSWAPGDRTSGNEVFHDVPIVSHRDARLKLAEYWKTAKGVAPPLPSLTFDSRLDLHLGGKEIRLLYLGRGHAPGDAVMYLPREGILFCSELFFNRVFPGLRTGFSREWIETIDRIKGVGATLVVPGHGDLADAETLRGRLEEFRQSLVDLRGEVEKAYRAGVPVDAAVHDVSLPKYRGWQLYGDLMERDVRRLYDELSGRVE
jgi:glyoxylase-like metal-dependent hydrolase (beta-lactamase superfamily II)